MKRRPRNRLKREKFISQLKRELLNEYGIIDLSGIYFGDMFVNIDNWKAQYIYQCFHKADVIYQGYHKANKIYQSRNTANTIYQQHQKAKKVFEGGHLIED